MLRAGVLGLVSLALFLLGLFALPAWAQEAAAQAPKALTFAEQLEQVLKGIDGQNIRSAPRPGASVAEKGTMRQSATVGDRVRMQLISKGCWADQDDLAQGRQLRTVIEVRFGADGKLAQPPALIEPPTMPTDDRPLEVFIARAMKAIETCEAKGFQLPAEFLAAQPIPIIEIDFRP
jgi:hypothetical protein